MPEFMIDGYQLIDNQWVKIQEVNLLLPENESKILGQVFHNTNRAFYYHKIDTQWFRATLNESKALVWTLLKAGAYPYWTLLSPNDPVHKTLSPVNEAAQTALTQVPEFKIPEANDEEQATYPGTLSRAYQAIVSTSISHNLEQPSDLTAEQWQMILKTCLYPGSSRTSLDAIQSDPKLLNAYQGIVRVLMIKNINRYTFQVDESLPTIGQVYDYTAWLIFQILENKEDLEPPILTDQNMASKKIGEVREGEILVYLGLDPVQHKFVKLLNELFTDQTVDLKAAIKEFSLDESVKLNDLFKAVRLLQPLDEWQARIWDDFLIIVTEGNYTLEQFGDKLVKFKSLDREEILKTRIDLLREKIELVTKMTDAEEIDLNNLRLEFLDSHGYAIMASLSEDKVQSLWMILPYRKDNKMDLDKSTQLRQEVFLYIFYSVSSREKWVEMVSEPGAVGLIQSILLSSSLFGASLIKCILWLPNAETQKESLIKLSETYENKFTFLARIRGPMSERNLDDVFESVLCDKRITEKFTQTHYWRLFNHVLSSNQIIRMLNNHSSLATAITDRVHVIELMDCLNADDQLTFLQKPYVIQTFKKENIPHINPDTLIDNLETSVKNKLTTTSDGMRLLAKYSDKESDFEQALSLFTQKVWKAAFIQLWCLENPERIVVCFVSLLKKYALTDIILNRQKEALVLKSFYLLENGANKDTLSIGFALFNIANHPHNSLKFMASLQFLKTAKFPKGTLISLIEQIPMPFRKGFIFSESILEQWKEHGLYSSNIYKLLPEENLNESETSQIESMMTDLLDLCNSLFFLHQNSFVDLIHKKRALIEKTLHVCRNQGDDAIRLNNIERYTTFLQLLYKDQFIESLGSPQITIISSLTTRLNELCGGSKLVDAIDDKLKQRSKKLEEEDVGEPDQKRIRLGK